jgi:hypothetical protein
MHPDAERALVELGCTKTQQMCKAIRNVRESNGFGRQLLKAGDCLVKRWSGFTKIDSFRHEISLPACTGNVVYLAMPFRIFTPFIDEDKEKASQIRPRKGQIPVSLPHRRALASP